MYVNFLKRSEKILTGTWSDSTRIWNSWITSFLNLTVVDDQKKEMPTEPTLVEREVDFNITLKDEKTKQEITNAMN